MINVHQKAVIDPDGVCLRPESPLYHKHFDHLDMALGRISRWVWRCGTTNRRDEQLGSLITKRIDFGINTLLQASGLQKLDDLENICVS